jgi:hypothetical protein
MHSRKLIQDYESFVSTAPQSWGGWAMTTALKMIPYFSKPNMEGKFVLVELAKERAEQVYQKCSVHGKNVLLVQELQSQLQGEFSSNSDIDLLITHLVQSKKAHIFEVPISGEQKQAIKFSREDVTEADKGLLHLRVVSKMLDLQKIDLEAKIKEYGRT